MDSLVGRERDLLAARERGCGGSGEISGAREGRLRRRKRRLYAIIALSQ